jgi:hypothetical protein
MFVRISSGLAELSALLQRAFPLSVTRFRKSVIFAFMNSTSAGLAGDAKKGVRLCRPRETILDLLDRMPAGPLYKEDVPDAEGRRIIY